MKTMVDNEKIARMEKDIKAVKSVPPSTTADAGKVLTVGENGNSEWKKASSELMGFRKITGDTTKKISTDMVNTYSEIVNKVWLGLREGNYKAGQIIPQNQSFRLNYVKNGNRVPTDKMNSEYVFNPNGSKVIKAYVREDETTTFEVSLIPGSYNASQIEVADAFEVRAVKDIAITINNNIIYVEMTYFG